MRVIIDCDPGLGKKFTPADVDDGLALFFMLNQPEIYNIEGITITYGNTRAKMGFNLLENYLKLTNTLYIPHYIGATSKEELGTLTNASKFLISHVTEHPNEIILFTLGPLTNIATAILNYPEFLDDLKQIIFMGGVLNPISLFNFGGNERFETSEFNFNKDPKATKLFIESDTLTPRVGIGLDVCSQVIFNRNHYNVVKSHNTVVSQYISENILNWLNLWETNFSKGFYPFDTLVPIYLIRKDLFKINKYHLTIDVDKIPGKINILKRVGYETKLVTYCTDFVSEKSKKDFMNILISGLTK